MPELDEPSLMTDAEWDKFLSQERHQSYVTSLSADNPYRFQSPSEHTRDLAVESLGQAITDVGQNTAGSVGKAGIAAGEGLVGLANIAASIDPTYQLYSRWRHGRFVAPGEHLQREVGYDPKAAKQFFEDMQSDQIKRERQEFGQAKGFWNKTGQLVTSPEMLADVLIESSPYFFGAGALGRVAKMGAPALSNTAAAVGAEGLIGAAAASENIRQDSPGGQLSDKQMAAAIASGVGTGLIGGAAGRIAKPLRLGDDVDTALVRGATVAAKSPRSNLAAGIAKGVLREGVLEELPQSVQEQMWQNYALGRPIMQGVEDAAASGMVAGAAMGGGLAPYVRVQQIAEEKAKRAQAILDASLAARRAAIQPPPIPTSPVVAPPVVAPPVVAPPSAPVAVPASAPATTQTTSTPVIGASASVADAPRVDTPELSPDKQIRIEKLRDEMEIAGQAGDEARVESLRQQIVEILSGSKSETLPPTAPVVETKSTVSPRPSKKKSKAPTPPSPPPSAPAAKKPTETAPADLGAGAAYPTPRNQIDVKGVENADAAVRVSKPNSPVRLRNEIDPAEEMLVTPSTKEPGKWQVTQVFNDATGQRVGGSLIYPTWDMAVRSAAGQKVDRELPAGSYAFKVSASPRPPADPETKAPAAEKPVSDAEIARQILDKEGRLSVSLLQRLERMPYSRAQAAVAELEKTGEITRPEKSGPWRKSGRVISTLDPKTNRIIGREGVKPAAASAPAAEKTGLAVLVKSAADRVRHKSAKPNFAVAPYAQAWVLPEGVSKEELDLATVGATPDEIVQIYDRLAELNPGLKDISVRAEGYAGSVGPYASAESSRDSRGRDTRPLRDVVRGVSSQFRQDDIKYFVEDLRGSGATRTGAYQPSEEEQAVMSASRKAGTRATMLIRPKSVSTTALTPDESEELNTLSSIPEEMLSPAQAARISILTAKQSAKGASQEVDTSDDIDKWTRVETHQQLAENYAKFLEAQGRESEAAEVRKAFESFRNKTYAPGTSLILALRPFSHLLVALQSEAIQESVDTLAQWVGLPSITVEIAPSVEQSSATGDFTSGGLVTTAEDKLGVDLVAFSTYGLFFNNALTPTGITTVLHELWHPIVTRALSDIAQSSGQSLSETVDDIYDQLDDRFKAEVKNTLWWDERRSEAVNRQVAVEEFLRATLQKYATKATHKEVADYLGLALGHASEELLQSGHPIGKVLTQALLSQQGKIKVGETPSFLTQVLERLRVFFGGARPPVRTAMDKVLQQALKVAGIKGTVKAAGKLQPASPPTVAVTPALNPKTVANKVRGRKKAKPAEVKPGESGGWFLGVTEQELRRLIVMSPEDRAEQKLAITQDLAAAKRPGVTHIVEIAEDSRIGALFTVSPATGETTLVFKASPQKEDSVAEETEAEGPELKDYGALTETAKKNLEGVVPKVRMELERAILGQLARGPHTGSVEAKHASLRQKQEWWSTLARDFEARASQELRDKFHAFINSVRTERVSRAEDSDNPTEDMILQSKGFRDTGAAQDDFDLRVFRILLSEVDYSGNELSDKFKGRVRAAFANKRVQVPRSIRKETGVPDYALADEGDDQARVDRFDDSQRDIRRSLPVLSKSSDTPTFTTQLNKELRSARPFGLQATRTGDLITRELLAKIRTGLPAIEQRLLQLSGLMDWLAPQTQVSKDSILEWLDQNGPKIVVHSYGAEGKVSEAARRIGEISHEVATKWGEPRSKEEYEDLPEEAKNLIEERDKLYDKQYELILSEPPDTTPRMTGEQVGAYRTVSPKDPKTHPVTRVDVAIPVKEFNRAAWDRGESSGHFWSPDNLHEKEPNTLGWAAIQYETGPNGEKIAHIFEAQSKWGQALREAKQQEKELGRGMAMVKGDPQDHPLLADYNRLIIKAAIDQARKEGATHIAISDAETAMMTERHDTVTPARSPFSFKNEKLAIEDAVKNGYNKDEVYITGGKDGPTWVAKVAKPSQEPGMRLNYDPSVQIVSKTKDANGEYKLLTEQRFPTEADAHTYADKMLRLKQASTYPKGWKGERFEGDYNLVRGQLHEIASDLTGDKGTEINLGEHKNAVIYDERPESGGPGRVVPRSNLIFTNPDGTPKTSVTARLYDISTPSAMLSRGESFSVAGFRRSLPVLSKSSDMFDKLGASVESVLHSLQTQDSVTDQERLTRVLFKYNEDTLQAPLDWLNRRLVDQGKDPVSLASLDFKNAFSDPTVAAAWESIPARMKTGEILNRWENFREEIKALKDADDYERRQSIEEMLNLFRTVANPPKSLLTEIKKLEAKLEKLPATLSPRAQEIVNFRESSVERAAARRAMSSPLLKQFAKLSTYTKSEPGLAGIPLHLLPPDQQEALLREQSGDVLDPKADEWPESQRPNDPTYAQGGLFDYVRQIRKAMSQGFAQTMWDTGLPLMRFFQNFDEMRRRSLRNLQAQEATLSHDIEELTKQEVQQNADNAQAAVNLRAALRAARGTMGKLSAEQQQELDARVGLVEQLKRRAGELLLLEDKQGSIEVLYDFLKGGPPQDAGKFEQMLRTVEQDFLVGRGDLLMVLRAVAISPAIRKVMLDVISSSEEAPLGLALKELIRAAKQPELTNPAAFDPNSATYKEAREKYKAAVAHRDQTIRTIVGALDRRVARGDRQLSDTQKKLKAALIKLRTLQNVNDVFESLGRNADFNAVRNQVEQSGFSKSALIGFNDGGNVEFRSFGLDPRTGEKSPLYHEGFTIVPGSWNRKNVAKQAREYFAALTKYRDLYSLTQLAYDAGSGPSPQELGLDAPTFKAVVLALNDEPMFNPLWLHHPELESGAESQGQAWFGRLAELWKRQDSLWGGLTFAQLDETAREMPGYFGQLLQRAVGEATRMLQGLSGLQSLSMDPLYESGLDKLRQEALESHRASKNDPTWDLETYRDKVFNFVTALGQSRKPALLVPGMTVPTTGEKVTREDIALLNAIAKSGEHIYSFISRREDKGILERHGKSLLSRFATLPSKYKTNRAGSRRLWEFAQEVLNDLRDISLLDADPNKVAKALAFWNQDKQLPHVVAHVAGAAFDADHDAVAHQTFLRAAEKELAERAMQGQTTLMDVTSVDEMVDRLAATKAAKDHSLDQVRTAFYAELDSLAQQARSIGQQPESEVTGEGATDWRQLQRVTSDNQFSNPFGSRRASFDLYNYGMLTDLDRFSMTRNAASRELVDMGQAIDAALQEVDRLLDKGESDPTFRDVFASHSEALTIQAQLRKMKLGYGNLISGDGRVVGERSPWAKLLPFGPKAFVSALLAKPIVTIGNLALAPIMQGFELSRMNVGQMGRTGVARGTARLALRSVKEFSKGLVSGPLEFAFTKFPGMRSKKGFWKAPMEWSLQFVENDRNRRAALRGLGGSDRLSFNEELRKGVNAHLVKQAKGDVRHSNLPLKYQSWQNWIENKLEEGMGGSLALTKAWGTTMADEPINVAIMLDFDMLDAGFQSVADAYLKRLIAAQLVDPNNIKASFERLQREVDPKEWRTIAKDFGRLTLVNQEARLQDLRATMRFSGSSLEHLFQDYLVRRETSLSESLFSSDDRRSFMQKMVQDVNAPTISNRPLAFATNKPVSDLFRLMGFGINATHKIAGSPARVRRTLAMRDAGQKNKPVIVDLSLYAWALSSAALFAAVGALWADPLRELYARYAHGQGKSKDIIYDPDVWLNGDWKRMAMLAARGTVVGIPTPMLADALNLAVTVDPFGRGFDPAANTLASSILRTAVGETVSLYTTAKAFANGETIGDAGTRLGRQAIDFGTRMVPLGRETAAVVARTGLAPIEAKQRQYQTAATERFALGSQPDLVRRGGMTAGLRSAMTPDVYREPKRMLMEAIQEKDVAKQQQAMRMINTALIEENKTLVEHGLAPTSMADKMQSLFTKEVPFANVTQRKLTEPQFAEAMRRLSPEQQQLIVQKQRVVNTALGGSAPSITVSSGGQGGGVVGSGSYSSSYRVPGFGRLSGGGGSTRVSTSAPSRNRLRRGLSARVRSRGLKPLRNRLIKRRRKSRI